MKPYWEDSGVTIYHADCREVAWPRRGCFGVDVNEAACEAAARWLEGTKPGLHREEESQGSLWR